MRIGQGYDVHRLCEGRPLILGGVPIAYERGLDGHSDADVLTHAVMDAILGALGMGDIGRWFPDSDARYRGADSLQLLGHVARWMEERGYAVCNVDATIVAQKPRRFFTPDGAESLPGAGRRPGQCQGHHGRGAGLYRQRSGHGGPGGVPAH